MSLDNIVSVTISTQTVSVSQANFGIPLVCAYTTVFPERVRSYSSLTAMVSDGFATTDVAYVMANALKAQNPSITEWKIGRRALAYTQGWTITPAAPAVAAVTKYTVTINGTAFQFTSDATPTVAEVCTGLTALINAGAEPVTATDNTTNIGLAADNAGDFNTIELTDDSDGEDLWTRLETTTDPGIATDLANIALEDNEWYGLNVDGQGPNEIAAAATWVEANNKLYGTTSGDTEIITSGTGDIASTLSGANRQRTYIAYDKNPHDRLGEAMMGEAFPFDPGSQTWKFKTPSGPTAGEYTETQIGYMEGKECNYFKEVGGVDIIQQGVVASGEFIDIVRGIDWLKARLQERIFSQLVNLRKVPYTNAGISLIEGEIRAQLQEGADDGLLDDTREFDDGTIGFIVTVPDVAVVSTTDKNNRLLPDVEFQAFLAGAIHSVQISGVVSV